MFGYGGVCNGVAGWGGGGLLGGLLGLLGIGALLAGLVLLGVWLWRRTASASSLTPVGYSALDTLQMRYARGQVSREEYLRTREELPSGTDGSEGVKP